MIPVTRTDVTPTTANAWVDVDVSSYVGSDAGNIAGVVLEVTYDDSGDYAIGFRKNGSTDTQKEDWPANYFGVPSHFYVYVGVDSNDIFECFIEDLEGKKVYLVGYIKNDEGKFFTNAIAKTTTNLETWEDCDISSDTGTDTAIVSFWITICTANDYYDAGIRTNGSTDTFLMSSYSYSGFYGGQAMGVDENEIVELYCETTSITFYLMGYLIDNANIFTNRIEYALSESDTWLDIDVSDNVPSGNNGAFFYMDACEYRMGLRKNGETYDNYYDVRRMKAHAWVELDANRIAEGKVESTSSKYYLLGYTNEPAGGGQSYSQTCSETLTLTDTFSKQADFVKSFVETIDLSDSISLLKKFFLTLSETLGISDNVSKLGKFKKTLSETLSLSEIFSKITKFKKAITDTISLSDTISTLKKFSLVLSETLSLSDVVSKIARFKKTLTDSLSLSDTIATLKKFSITLSETIGLTDILQTLKKFSITLSETLSLSEIFSKVANYKKTISETISLTDIVSTTKKFFLTLSETIGLTDLVSVLKKFSITLSETLNLSDVLSKLTKFKKTITETLHLRDIISIPGAWWDTITKSVTNWTKQSKSSTTWTKQSKSTTSWTKQSKSQ